MSSCYDSRATPFPRPVSLNSSHPLSACTPTQMGNSFLPPLRQPTPLVHGLDRGQIALELDPNSPPSKHALLPPVRGLPSGATRMCVNPDLPPWRLGEAPAVSLPAGTRRGESERGCVLKAGGVCEHMCARVHAQVRVSVCARACACVGMYVGAGQTAS